MKNSERYEIELLGKTLNQVSQFLNSMDDLDETWLHISEAIESALSAGAMLCAKIEDIVKGEDK